MKKKLNAILILRLCLSLMLISASTNLFAAGINLVSPSDYNKCIVEGEISFNWDYDNPNLHPITDVVINFYKDTTTLILSEQLSDYSTSYSFNTLDVTDMDARTSYKWEILANINGVPFSSKRYYWLVPTPKFSEKSLLDGTNCVETELILDWTPAVPEFDYFYEVQVSKNIIFDDLVPVISAETSASMELLENTTYYWRLRDINCPNNFSDIRTFSTIHLPVTLSEPLNLTQCAVIEDNGKYYTDLKWESDVESGVNYNLEIFDVIGDSLLLETTVTAKNFLFDITDLLDGQIKWRVQLVEYNGEDYCNTSWSELYYFYTPLPTPESLYPSDNKCVSLNSEFRWADNLTSDSVEILISNTSYFSDTVHYISLLNDTNCFVITLPETSHKYFYKIRAKTYKNIIDDKIAIYSSWTEIFSFETTTLGPTLVNPPNNTTGINDIVELVWNKIPDVTSYKIEICSDSNFNQKALLFNTTSVSDTLFAYNIRKDIEVNYFYWRVIAENGITGCFSDYSEIRSFSTALSVPIAFYPKNNDTTYNNNIAFTWTKVAQATNYDLEYSLDSNALVTNDYNKIISKNNIVDTTFSIYMLNYNTYYYWRIKAKNNIGAISTWSEIYKFNTGVATPEKVELISPNDKAENIALIGIYKWHSALHSTEYQMELANNTEFTENNISFTISTADTTFNHSLFNDISPLEYNTLYYWRVRGTNNNTTFGAWSEIYSFTTAPAITDKVNLITPINNDTEVYADNAVFTWSKVSMATSYKLTISDMTDNVILDSLIVNDTTCTYKNLEKNTTYKWIVLPCNENGDGTIWSDTWSFTTKDGLGILDNTILNSMSVTPNPANNNAILKISSINSRTVSMSIIDINGNIVLTNKVELNTGNNLVNISLNTLLSGNYTLSLYSNGKLIGSTSLIIAK